MRKKSPNKPITIVDIAQKANVSVSTVSRTINKPHLVSAKKKNLINEIIKAENFIISRNAQAFSSNHSKNVVLIMGDEVDSIHYAKFIKNLITLFNTYNYVIVVYEETKNAFLNENTKQKILSARPCIIVGFNKPYLDILKSSYNHFEPILLKKEKINDLKDCIVKVRTLIKVHENNKNN